MFGDSSLTFRQRQQPIKEGDERQRGRNSDRGAGDKPDQLLGRPLAEDGQEPPAEQSVDDRADQRREYNPFKHTLSFVTGLWSFVICHLSFVIRLVSE